MDGTHLHDLVQIAKPYLEHYGYAAIFGCIFLENVCFPVPGESLLIAAALLASHGQMQILLVILTAWIAAVLGSAVGFWIGRSGGRRLVEKYGSYVGMTAKRLQWIDAFFDRYGGPVIVVSRFLEGLRQVTGILVGAGKMSWRKFMVYNTIGGLVWVGSWGTVVYWLGRGSRHIVFNFHTAEPYLIAAFVVLVAIVAVVFYRRGIRTDGGRIPPPPVEAGDRIE
jgi:membrane protein DedA with SNARE-associated domain